MRKILTLVCILALSMTAMAEWNFRGTANAWVNTAMTYNSSTGLYETTQTFGNDSPRFKIDRYGNWSENYPAQDYVVEGNKTYDITINPSTKVVNAVEVGGVVVVDSWYFRGTANSWIATEMTYNESTGLYETIQTFAAGDSGGGPRFKICHDTNWGENYPAQDATVDGNNTYLVTFNASTKAIVSTAESIDPPVAPTGLMVSGATQSSLVVSWTSVSNANSYELFKSNSATGTYTSIGTTSDSSYTVSGLNQGSNYYFKAKAVNVGGSSALSAYAFGTTTELEIPVAPTGLVSSDETQSSLVISWTAVSGADEYKVYTTTTATGTYTVAATTSSTTATLTGLNEDSLYYIKVKAINAAGESNYSAVLLGRTESTPADTWYFRGTANGWAATLMSHNSSTGLYETTQDFITGDEEPRFKISHDTNWGENYPATDYIVEANKSYLVTFNASTKEVLATEKESTVVTVSSNTATKETTATTLTVTLNVSGAGAVARYGIDGAATNGTIYTDGETVNINLANVGDSVVLNLYGSNSDSTDSASYTYTRVEEQEVSTNGTMMQYFHWYQDGYDTESQSGLWTEVADNADELSEMGITALWLPPAYKGDGGIGNVGYGVYDMYDLGEFYQHGTIPTKYGTKDQYLNAINTAHNNGMQIYGDVVFNHRGGADSTAMVDATRVEWGNRNNSQGDKRIEAWVNFDFPGRNNTYSDFKWRWYHFDAVDWDAATSEKAIFKLQGKGWDWEVDTENGNYDYLMYADLDMDNSEVVQELKDWGNWYVNFTGVDGFRIDAVKHMKFSFFQDWLDDVRNNTGKELFSVGEYWNYDVGSLHNYIEKSGGVMSLFDAPLHMNFFNASNASGNFDMSSLKNGTLMGENPSKAVTLVENHDTQPLQALESTVNWWFKELAYSFILLRNEGYPNVFYADLYGTSYRDQKDGVWYDINMAAVPNLAKLIKARKLYAYGEQYDYMDDGDVIGWTRLGDAEHGNKGMAVVMSDRGAGSKWMNTEKANATFYDYTGNRTDKIYTDGSGNASFTCNAGSVSVWVQE